MRNAGDTTASLLSVRPRLVLLVALAFALPGVYTAADEPGEAPTVVPAEEEARSRPTAIEEIRVTARKREESLPGDPGRHHELLRDGSP